MDINKNLKQKIIEYINLKDYAKVTVKSLAVIFGVASPENIKEMEKTISKLEIEGHLYIDDSKRICNLKTENKHVCKYESKSSGYGFGRVINNNDKDIEDIYITSSNLNGALNEDIVLVSVIDKNTENKAHIEGKVIKIIKRSDKHIIGIFKKSDNFGFVEVIDSSMDDIYISYQDQRGVENLDRVSVKIKKYATNNKKAEGKIVEIIGHEGDENLDILVMLKANDIKMDFNQNQIKEAESLSNITDEDLKKRIDLTKIDTFTIDSDDAKDLDDAVSIKHENDIYILSVHIADVSYYVKENSFLDQEAILRGTSVYIPGMVIPMLPRSLSNGICSLTENELRLTKTVEIAIDKTGKELYSNIYNSYIISKKQMTYSKVIKVLEKSDNEVLDEYKEFEKDLNLMHELFKILKAKRQKTGSIDFDIPEAKIVLDDKKQVVSVSAYEITDANMIIEEFMLVANKAVAKTFYELEAPFIYRIHEKPDLDSLRQLNETLNPLNVNIKGINKIHPGAINEALKSVKYDEEKYMIISKLILRSLKLAKYSDISLGHFGLNFTYYTHFTSPIRRYPDLFIHRVISYYLDNNYNLDEKVKERLEKKAYKYAIISSECEKKATKTERDVTSYYMAKYMKKNIGKIFSGNISSITNFGMYVKLDNLIEGFVSFSSLEDDYYIFYEKTLKLIGQRTNKEYNIGKKVDIKVESVNEQLRQIDFKIIK